MSLLIPEINIKNILGVILAFIKTDYDNASPKTQSYLYHILNGLKIEKYDFYTQAVEIFTRDKGHPRKIEVNYFFNAERSNIPSIHITLPQETPIADGIGIDDGFNGNEVDGTTGKKLYNRCFTANYHIVITSDSTIEVITMYHVIRSMLIAAYNDLMFAGIQNPKISGGELQLNSDIIPINVYARALNLQLMYDVPALSFLTMEMMSLGTITGVPVNEDLSDSLII